MEKYMSETTERGFKMLEEMDKIIEDNNRKFKIYSNKNIPKLDILNTFPNGLLIDYIIDEEEPVQSKTDKKNVDIWSVIDQIDKNTTSDTDPENSETEDEVPVCPDCGSTKLVENTTASILVCSDCGVICEELFDNGPEWKRYNNEDGRGEVSDRCGCPTNYLLPKSSQGTIMTGLRNNNLNRRQGWDSVIYRERILMKTFDEITKVCEAAHIPKNVIDDAKIYYKRISDCKHKNGKSKGKQVIIRGEKRRSILAACVSEACKKNKTPRSIKEISKIFSLPEKRVTHGLKSYEKTLAESTGQAPLVQTTQNNETIDYVRCHCADLKINKDNTDLAVKIADNCCKLKFASDHNPYSIAAGSILLMINHLGLKRDKKDISKSFQTSDVTISKIYKKIAPFVKALVDDEATEYLMNELNIGSRDSE